MLHGRRAFDRRAARRLLRVNVLEPRRGLREKLARKLITQGFLEEVLEKFGVDALTPAVDAILEDKFRAMGLPAEG